MTYSVTGSNPGQVPTKPYCKIKCKFVGIFQNNTINYYYHGYDDVIFTCFKTFNATSNFVQNMLLFFTAMKQE